MSDRPFDAFALRIAWWAEDRTVEERFCVSLLARDDDGSDEVLVDECGRVVAQASVESLRARAAELGHVLVEDAPGPSDVDLVGVRRRISAWPGEADCIAMVDALNFLTEVARSTGQRLGFSGRDATLAHEKIFWGTGILRAEEAEPWQPWLSRRQQRKLHQILARGTARLQQRIGSTRDSRFERLTLAVNREDPAGLVALDCGHYEYSLEVDDLTVLGPDAGPDDVLEIFDRWFEDSHDLSREAAERIASVVRQD